MQWQPQQNTHGGPPERPERAPSPSRISDLGIWPNAGPSVDEFGQNGFFFTYFFSVLFFFLWPKKRRLGPGSQRGRGSSARFCDLCVRLIHLFAYRFGVFSPPEHTVFLSREHLEKDCRFFNILNLT